MRWKRRPEAQREALLRHLVDVLCAKLEDIAGHKFSLERKPDKDIRDKPAPDYEIKDAVTGKVFPVEMVQDRNFWGEDVPMSKGEVLGGTVPSHDDIAARLNRLLEKKQGRGQLKDYAIGTRILLIVIQTASGLVASETWEIGDWRRAIASLDMDQFPDIDHVFVIWTTDPSRIGYLWKRAAIQV